MTPVTQKHPDVDDPRFTAAMTWLGKSTGAKSLQIRYSDDEQPIVWLAVGEWDNPVVKGHECAAGMGPLTAVMRLCEQVSDGGICTHCRKPTGFVPEADPGPMPLTDHVCWWTFDGSAYVRGCAT